MFHKLFSFISGFNSENQTIEMTVPVISKLSPLNYYHITKEMCNPPQATDKAVAIKKSNERVVLVKKFRGNAMTDYVLMDNAASFYRELEISGRADEIIPGYFSTAGYDSRGTRYEVMFEKLQVASHESKQSVPMPLLLKVRKLTI